MAAPQIKGSISDTDQILVEEKGCARILTMNRPKQLNALSSQMILKMLKLFIAYEEDPTVKLLIVKGKGRAFCAGGDVAAVAHSVTEGDWTNGANYFWNEYILNYIVATYRKPQGYFGKHRGQTAGFQKWGRFLAIQPKVSILNGIVMGGGAGVSIHGRFRVATEKSVFAMPETALGLFPDVGASYFLSRLPGFFAKQLLFMMPAIYGLIVLSHCFCTRQWTISPHLLSHILVDEKGCARILTMNRPKQLNALSSQMILKMLKLFIAYEEDPTVKLLIVKGKGRAFCAGGDVAAVAHSVTEGDWTNGANYFWNEYILNYIVATYRKPQGYFGKHRGQTAGFQKWGRFLAIQPKVSILNGIVMGGGAGVSIHGRFRVATEKSVFAMPETALGLFPDVGASYFLSRLPGFFGEYVGLTGARLDGAEMLACGLATHFVPSTSLGLLEGSLNGVDSSDPFTICGIIDQFSQQMPLKDSCAFNSLDIIDKCFCQRTVEEILSALEQEAVHGPREWILAAIESLKKASPTSLKISLRSIREGRMQQISQCLIQDYRMCCHVLQKELSKDYFEGCRAILVDKDRNPKWGPSRLDMVDDAMVERYFSKVDDAGWEDLELPERSSSSIASMSKL